MLYSLDEDGYVINEASLDKVDDVYRPLVVDTLNGLKAKFSDKLHSIYLRGSVSVGRAEPNISDLDMVVILSIPPTEEELIWRQDFASTLEKEYSFVTLVDLTCITLEELLSGEEYVRLRIYLATQSVCLYGKNILGTLGRVRPNKELACKMYQNISKELEELKEYFSDPTETRSYLGEIRPPQFWCVWLMRVLLRSGLGLVMCQRPVYSQDLQTCCVEFVKMYPEYKLEMSQVLLWAHEPVGDKKRIAAFADNFIPKYLDLWKLICL